MENIGRILGGFFVGQENYGIQTNVLGMFSPSFDSPSESLPDSHFITFQLFISENFTHATLLPCKTSCNFSSPIHPPKKEGSAAKSRTYFLRESIPLKKKSPEDSSVECSSYR